MILLITSLLASVAIVAAFAIKAIPKIGLPLYMADMHFKLKEAGHKSYFPLILTIAAFLLMIPMDYFGSQSVNWIAWVIFLCVAVTAQLCIISQKATDIASYITMFVAFAGVMIWAIFTRDLLWLAPFASVASMTYLFVTKREYWRLWFQLAVILGIIISVITEFVISLN